MPDIKIRFQTDKEVVTCSHGKQLNSNEIVGKCRICNKYTCADCNMNLPASSIIGHYCKSCFFKLLIKIITMSILIFMSVRLISTIIYSLSYGFGHYLDSDSNIKNVLYLALVVLILRLLKNN